MSQEEVRKGGKVYKLLVTSSHSFSYGGSSGRGGCHVLFVEFPPHRWRHQGWEGGSPPNKVMDKNYKKKKKIAKNQKQNFI